MTKRLESKRCRICKHEWFPRKPGKPKRCPNCMSRRWDTATNILIVRRRLHRALRDRIATDVAQGLKIRKRASDDTA